VTPTEQAVSPTGSDPVVPTVAATATRRFARERRPLWRRALPVLTALLLLGVWQALAFSDQSGLTPSPLGIAVAVPAVVASPAFWSAAGETSLAIAQGIVIGCTLGTVLGVIVGRFSWFRHLTALYVSGLYAMPLLAIVPLITIWMGYSSTARFVVVVIAATLPSIVSTADGARRVPHDLEDAMVVLRVSPSRRLVDLVLPATLPYIMAGINVALGRVIVGAVAVEFLASVPGLGTFILTSARSFHQNEAFVGVLLLVVIGVVGHALIERLRRTVAPWQTSSVR